MSEESPKILIIAGPNGAGKTTFAREYLPNEGSCSLFVNADLIAAGLSPFAPDLVAIRAGRLMLSEIAEHVRKRESFAFETTLAGRAYAGMIPRWGACGYSVHLVFLKLDSEALAVERVAVRIAQGGHAIPEAVIRRRFSQGLSNFSKIYCPLVDSWRLYDNSDESPRLIDQGGQP